MVKKDISMRRQAEKILKLRPESAPAPKSAELIHELRVHQVELEMQNEELQRAQDEIAKSNARYADLFNFAPVGYFTFDRDGRILDVNFPGADLLGKPRAKLIGRPFQSFITPEYQEAIHLHRVKVFKTRRKETCEIKLRHEDTYVELVSRANPDDMDNSGNWRAAAIDISERKQAELHLQDSYKRLQRLSSELTLAEERERRRLGVELHDQLGQILAIAKMRLGPLMQKTKSADLKDIYELLNQAILSTRSLTRELSPPVLHELSFVDSLEWLAENIQSRFGTPVEFKAGRRLKNPKHEVQVLLFRSVGELLTNAAKHAEASKIRLLAGKERGNYLLQVIDDGKGLDKKKLLDSEGFGLRSIRERIENMGGKMLIDSEQGKGTSVKLEVPDLE